MTQPRNSRTALRLAAAAAAAWAAAIPAALAQAPGDPALELIRKAERGEQDGGLCATIDWPPGTGEGYVAFLRMAEIGTTKRNRFRNNAQCQVDRVTDVFNGETGKCVRYTWYACVTGGSCARGEDTECRQPDGSWKRQPK